VQGWTSLAVSAAAGGGSTTIDVLPQRTRNNKFFDSTIALGLKLTAIPYGISGINL
jgi:hypothetical protein